MALFVSMWAAVGCLLQMGFDKKAGWQSKGVLLQPLKMKRWILRFAE